MRAAKEIVLVAVFTAWLIGGQLALSAIAGVEVVTVLILTFAYAFGCRRAAAAAVCFSLLRCLIFGFFPTVVLLYLIYYPLFGLTVGALGHLFRRRVTPLTVAALVAAAAVMTAVFTLLDDVITPLVYGFSPETWAAYAVASVPTMIAQIVCAAATTAALFAPLMKVFSRFRI